MGVLEEITHYSRHRYTSLSLSRDKMVDERRSAGQGAWNFWCPGKKVSTLTFWWYSQPSLEKITGSHRCMCRQKHIYMEVLLKYETILTAQIFCASLIRRLPCLKTSKQLEWIWWQYIVSSLALSRYLENLKIYARDFESVQSSADNFMVLANDELLNEDWGSGGWSCTALSKFKEE